MEKLSDHLYIPPMGIVLRDREKARQAAKPAKRNFASAKITRQNKDWTATPYSANWTLYRDLRILRARAREMAKNAPHFRKFLLMAKTNIVGHKGIQLQCNAEFGSNRPNTNLNSRVESAWWEWSFPENCSASGKLSWVSAQQLFVEHLLRDGEALVQHIDADNAFGYTLKFWNVDWLDETYNETLPSSGNRVIMSVEVDGNDRPVAYWLTTPPSDINFTHQRGRTRTRISADEMTHAFMISEDESQTRGVTWFYAGLLHGKGMHEYTGGVVDSARVASHSLGFLKKNTPDEVEFMGEEDEFGNQRPLEIDVAPLSMNELPDGYELQQFDPKQPTQNHSEFKRSMLLDVAASLGVNGFSLAGDMSAVNFSSARVGLGEERELWRQMQTFVSSTLCREVYRRWLRSTVAAGKIDLSAREFAQLQNPTWRARGWRYIEPTKDITAAIDGIGNNLLTFRDHLADQGIDLEEFLIAKKAEMELFAKYGIEYGVAKETPPPPPAAESDDTEENNSNPPPDDAERGYTNGHSFEMID